MRRDCKTCWPARTWPARERCGERRSQCLMPRFRIAGTARLDEPEPVWIARSKTHIAELSLLCSDLVGRGKVAIYAGGEGRKWYMPLARPIEFFDDGGSRSIRAACMAESSRSSSSLKKFTTASPSTAASGQPSFKSSSAGYDPDSERRGHPLPLHFHWIFMSDDPKVPSAVHCSHRSVQPDNHSRPHRCVPSGSEAGNPSGGLEAILLSVNLEGYRSKTPSTLTSKIAIS